MKPFLRWCWLVSLSLLIIYGATLIREEWKRKFIHEHGELVNVEIEQLNCPQQLMTFRFGVQHFRKEIDARTCVLFNVLQTIKLKHSARYPDTFLFANERSPNRFLLGGLLIALGIIGLVANWPLFNYRHSDKNFRSVS